MARYQGLKGHYIEHLGDIIQALNPLEHHVHERVPVASFCMDSRRMKPGDVFVAVRGTRTDGHRFVDAMLANGAAAALVSSLDQVAHKKGCILVENSVEALRLLAAQHRRAVKTRIIGLTGSVGKTTTKEILATLMNEHVLTRKSDGNFNNTFGLPMEILKIRREEEWMVAEMGMSTPGEIALLADMVDPEIGMLMSVREVHLANFKDIDQIALAKAELVRGMRPDGCLVYNADDPLVCKHSQSYPGRKLSYGMVSPRAEITASAEPNSDWQGTHIQLSLPEGQRVKVYLPLVGHYNVYNALAAIAAAIAAGVPYQKLEPALAKVSTTSGRSCLHRLAREIRLVDDTYNANPDAVAQVVQSFEPLKACHYRWLILGDMRELGEQEQAIHRRLGSRLAACGFQRITLVGSLTHHTYRSLLKEGPASLVVEHYPDTSAAIETLSIEVPAQTRIWLKASRGIGLEAVAHHLIKRLAPTLKAN